MKILICGGGARESQANSQVVKTIRDGWEELLGADQVRYSSVVGAAAVIAEFQPTLVMFSGSYLPEYSYYSEVRQAATGVGARMVFWATEDPYEQDASYRIVRDFDLIFTCESTSIPYYKRDNVYHLPLAASPSEHFRPIDQNRLQPIDILFCGVAFASRRRIVELVRPMFRGLDVAIVGPGWEGLGMGFSGRRIDKTELIDLYSSAKLVLNLGRSLHFENATYRIAPTTPGPRTFEAAMAGATQVFHEETPEIWDYFDPDEILTFSAPHDFRQVVQPLLNDPARRYAIAAAAQRRAIDCHTYRHRAERIVSVLDQEALL